MEKWTVWDSLKFIFHWRIIALQCSVCFCYATTWISHRYKCVPSLLNLAPTPLGCHRAPGWAPCVIQQLSISYLFYISNVYISMLLSLFIPRSPVPAVSISLFSNPLFLTSTQSGLLYRRITKFSLASHTKKENIPFPAFCGLLS